MIVPPEILVMIFGHLPCESALAVRATCREWRDAACGLFVPLDWRAFYNEAIFRSHDRPPPANIILAAAHCALRGDRAQFITWVGKSAVRALCGRARFEAKKWAYILLDLLIAERYEYFVIVFHYCPPSPTLTALHSVLGDYLGRCDDPRTVDAAFDIDVKTELSVGYNRNVAPRFKHPLLCYALLTAGYAIATNFARTVINSHSLDGVPRALVAVGAIMLSGIPRSEKTIDNLQRGIITFPVGW